MSLQWETEWGRGGLFCFEVAFSLASCYGLGGGGGDQWGLCTLRKSTFSPNQPPLREEALQGVEVCTKLASAHLSSCACGYRKGGFQLLPFLANYMGPNMNITGLRQESV